MGALNAVQDTLVKMENVKVSSVWIMHVFYWNTFNFISQTNYDLRSGFIFLFIIECFGAVGPDCSTPCESNFFGYLCKDQCDCPTNETCNRYFGCKSIGEFPFKLV